VLLVLSHKTRQVLVTPPVSLVDIVYQVQVLVQLVLRVIRACLAPMVVPPVHLEHTVPRGVLLHVLIVQVDITLPDTTVLVAVFAHLERTRVLVVPPVQLVLVVILAQLDHLSVQVHALQVPTHQQELRLVLPVQQECIVLLQDRVSVHYVPQEPTLVLVQVLVRVV